MKFNVSSTRTVLSVAFNVQSRYSSHVSNCSSVKSVMLYVKFMVMFVIVIPLGGPIKVTTGGGIKVDKIVMY